MQENSGEDKDTINPPRPVLGRRVTCQYYSPALVLSSNDEKRLQVVLELLQTEEKYNCCLHTLKSVFEDKLYSTNIIPVKDVESIFPAGLKDIREIHDRLCSALKVRIQQWNYRSKVGDVFVHFFSSKNQFDLLGQYSSYSNNFPKAIRTISRCIRYSTEFESFLQNSSNGPSWKGLDLHALLLNPIQRLPRYILLLKQLMRFTDVNHPDRVHVEQALVTMSHTVTVLNNSIDSSLKVACEYTTRKRLTRRRSSPYNPRDVIRVLNRTTDQHNVSKEMKPKTEELSGAATGQSRPVSICSSVSSGYASGEEGDNSTPNSTSFTIVCPCNGPTCNAKQQEFSHLVKELRHESALEQLAQQKFDFSVSCISPPLQRLHALRLQRASVIPESETGEIDKDPEDVQDANCTANSDTQSRTQSESKSEGTKTLSNLDKEDVLSDSIEETIDQTMDNFIEDFSNTLNNFENLHLMKVLLPDQLPINSRRSHSDGLHLQNQASCGSERDLGFLSSLDKTPLISQSSSSFRKIRRDRRSWATPSSLSKQYVDGILPPQSVLGSLQDVVVDDDCSSVWSDLSTLSGDSSVSGVSAMSVPVDGKHATKRKYFRLKEFFRQLKTKERRSQTLTARTNMSTIPQEDTKPDKSPSPPRITMISSV